MPITPPFQPARNATLWAVLLASPALHAEDLQFNFDIPAQPLPGALDSLAQTSQIKLIYADDSVKGLKSAPIKGRYTATEALKMALDDTGLRYEVVDKSLITVKKSPVETKPEPRSENTALAPMTVVGQAELDDPKSYRAVRSSSSTKTDTPIMETPQSIQVIKRSVIDDQQNITVSEALRNVSGVVPNNPLYTPAVDNTRIRGFAAEQLIDGFTQYYNPGDRESTVNIERIEVLKGTNGILYSGGSGSPVGGLVNIVSKLPQHNASGELGFKIGTNNWYQPFLDINQPLHENVLFRFTGEYTDAGSYLDTVETERYNLNPAVTFTNNEDTSLTLQAKISRWYQPEYQGLPATGTLTGNFKIPKYSFLGPSDVPESSSEFNGVWGTFDHQFNDIWSINLKARYANSQFDEKVQTLFGADSFVADRPLDAFPPLIPNNTWGLVNAELFQEQEERSFLGNVTAKFDAGPTKNTVLIGADHSDYEDKGFIDADLFNTGFIDLSAPTYTYFLPYNDPGPGVNNQLVDNTTYGGYLQWQSSIYDRLHILAGVRVGHVTTEFQNVSFGMSSKADKTKVLPRVGAVFDVVDGASLFISYNEGMRGQPFVNFSNSPEPEESTTLEGGLKFDIAHQLTGQIAGYQIERSHVAVTDFTDPFFRSVAKGQQRSRGVETDLTWQATENLSILANYAHTDAEFTDNLAGVPEGNRLAMVPENSGRLWVNYRFQQAPVQGLSIGGGLYAQSDAFLSNNNVFKTPGYHSFDASIAYELKQFRIAATIKNLTDEDYFQPFGYFGGRVIPAEGTSAYVTASFKY